MYKSTLRNILLITLGVSMAGMFNCGPLFPTMYDRVDADRVRILDFIYEPAEAAPGDTVSVTAIFAGAGDSLVPEDISWSVSFKMLSNLYGIDTALEVVPLDTMQYSQSYFSERTSCITFSFKIPDRVMHESPMIPEDWTSLIPNQTQSLLPDFVYDMNKELLLSLIETFSLSARQWGVLIRNDSSAADSLYQNDPLYKAYVDSLQDYIPAITQLLTIKIRLFADITGAHRVRSDYYIRYNNRFKDIPGSRVYVNTNPVIDSIGVYKVKKEGLLAFDPEIDIVKYPTEFIRLYGEGDTIPGAQTADSLQTIIVDKGYSYFVSVFTNAPDLSMTIDSAIFGGSPVSEVLFSQWYFQLDETETEGVSAYDFMNIVNVGNLTVSLYPPLDKRVETFTIWCEVYDFLLNEIYRPKASSLREVRGRFTYTSTYLKSIKNRK